MTKQKDTFCPAPWITFYLEPNGRVDLCCTGSAELGSIHDQSLDDILASPKMAEIKRRMRENQPVPGCEACHGGHDTNLQSRFVKEYGGRGHPDYQDPDAFKLKYLDLRWNNTCNYACVYCGPELSSLWAQQSGHKQFKITNQRSDLIDRVLHSLDTIEEIYLAGGEPLMLKENAVILRRLHEVNPACRIMVNTNLSLIHDNDIFNLLMQFNNVQWIVSAESCGDSYEYMRWPGDWPTFSQNLRHLQDLAATKRLAQPGHQHQITFNAVWCALNGLELWDYVDYLLAQGLGINGLSVLSYNMDTWAGPWHLKHMPKQYLQRVRDRMDDPKYHDIHTYAQNLEFIDRYLHDHSISPDPDTVKAQLDFLDRSRNIASRKVFATTYQYLDHTED